MFDLTEIFKCNLSRLANRIIRDRELTEDIATLVTDIIYRAKTSTQLSYMMDDLIILHPDIPDEHYITLLKIKRALDVLLKVYEERLYSSVISYSFPLKKEETLHSPPTDQELLQFLQEGDKNRKEMRK